MATSSLVSLHLLPDRFRPLFPFSTLNHAQSQAFSCVYFSDHNYVLSAPTGSGKTVILELAICRLVSQLPSRTFKVVYLAPTRSLCFERYRDWQSKFHLLNLNCLAFTGDDVGPVEKLHNADIIISTPEKWDMVTRKWKDHGKLMQTVKLFLIDEVHSLTETRGATLEAVVSRMRRLESNIRFIALSATIPNIEDVAQWLYSNDYANTAAKYDVFGDEHRPVPLQKFVYGVTSRRNEYIVDQACDERLLEVISYHGAHRPSLVFCMTRKGAMKTAKLLSEEWSAASVAHRPWPAPADSVHLSSDPVLQELMSSGVAFHHAGLQPKDRTLVEDAFRACSLSVICCTSTLAVGVNLPCHLVIIKNTLCWGSDGPKEYSEMEITQMIGRAGRPQFDDDAVAVILTQQEKVAKYQRLVAGSQIVESSLHLQLLEHLNSELSTAFVKNRADAVQWLAGTFLAVRLRKNPRHYTIDGVKGRFRDFSDRLQQICRTFIDILTEAGLLREEHEELRSTEFGLIMSKYYTKLKTMRRIIALSPRPTINDILSLIAETDEFHDVKWSRGDAKFYDHLNTSSEIRYPIKSTPSTTAHKVSILVQAYLGDVSFPESGRVEYNKKQYELDARIIFGTVERLVRCVVDCQIHLQSGIGVRNALELARSLGARAWDDSPAQMRQIHGIGPVAVKKLVGANICSLNALKEAGPHQINVVMGRNPGYGESLLKNMDAIPNPSLCLRENGTRYCEQKYLLQFTAMISFLNTNVPETFNKQPIYVCFLAERSNGSLVDFRRMLAKVALQSPLYVSASLEDPREAVSCYVMCDGVAGSLRKAVIRARHPPETHTDQEGLTERSRPAYPQTENFSISGGSSDLLDDGDLGIDEAFNEFCSSHNWEAPVISTHPYVVTSMQEAAVDAATQPQRTRDSNTGLPVGRNRSTVEPEALLQHQSCTGRLKETGLLLKTNKRALPDSDSDSARKTTSRRKKLFNMDLNPSSSVSPPADHANHSEQGSPNLANTVQGADSQVPESVVVDEDFVDMYALYARKHGEHGNAPKTRSFFPQPPSSLGVCASRQSLEQVSSSAEGFRPTETCQSLHESGRLLVTKSAYPDAVNTGELSVHRSKEGETTGYFAHTPLEDEFYDIINNVAPIWPM